MKKKNYIKPASLLLPSPLLLAPTILSKQQIGPTDPTNPPTPIGGEGDENDGNEVNQRIGDPEEFGTIPYSLW